MLNVVLAVVLIAASLAVVIYLAMLLLRAANLPLSSLVERQRFQRRVAHAQRADRALEQGALDTALRELQAAFYPSPTSSRELANAIGRHHVGLLSRFLAAADQLHGDRVRLMSLAKADRLFHERNDLQRRYLAARQGGSRQRRRDLDEAFEANTRDVRSTLASLATEIRAVQSVQKAARYH